jgi:predicted cation transporter
MVLAGLSGILAVILLIPFLIKQIEENLEFFLFVMGCFAVTVASQWSMHLVEEALLEPIKITLAVFVAGLLFRVLQKSIAHHVNKIADAIGIRFFAFLMIVVLGVLSSVITAIIASLVLVEIISCLKLDRKHEIQMVILTCFSIGLGAALTPIGEPLSTITVAKLKGDPFHADFFFLFRHLWRYIIPGVIAFGFLGFMLMPVKNEKGRGLRDEKMEDLKKIILRTGKVYIFIMALIFLGRGFKPIVDTFISKMPYQWLYWLNSFSAVLDNATLAAAEIGPSMGLLQIKSALMALLIAGGMLVPGNIPNIISAGKLKIKSSEWAKFGVPLGLFAMLIYFFLLRCGV